MPVIPAQPHVIPADAGIQLRFCHSGLRDRQATYRARIVPQSGSHKHFVSDAEIGTGKYTNSNPVILSSTDADTAITSTTDADGEFFAVYASGEWGVREKVTVTVTNPETNEGLETTGAFDIRVPDLIPLKHDGSLYLLKGSYSGTCDQQHNDGPTSRRSHYLKTNVLNSIENVANDYFSRTGAKLSFNDASLEYGGFFDYGDNANRTKRCHKSHRRGIDIDINSIDGLNRDIWFDFYLGPNKCVILLFEDLERRAIIHGGRRIVEDNSIHYRFDRAN